MTCRGCVACAIVAGVLAAELASAQLAPPNAAGVAMGHLHYRVRDVAANERFWETLGGRGARFGAETVVLFPDVAVFLEPGESSGVSDGAIVNHVAFRVPSLEAIEARGLKVQRLAQFPGVAYVFSPEGERVELFDNSATNLTFTFEAGASSEIAQRHNRPLSAPIAFHHIHLYLPDEKTVGEAKAWYARMFGGTPGKRAQYDAVDLPGVNFNFSANPRPTAPTKGRTLDHIGFEVTNLEAFVRRLESMGVKVVTPFATQAAPPLARATIADPWGTTIELTEGLR